MKHGGFKADDLSVLRFPVLESGTLFDLATTGTEALAEKVRIYLSDPYTREAIYLASPSLYQRMCAWEAGESVFNGIPETISRYLLRMAYRATPFGTFSAVSHCTVAGCETTIRIPMRKHMRRLAQLDGSALSRLALKCAADPDVRTGLCFSPNDTLFVNGDVIVFTAYARNKRGRRIYRRVEVESSAYVEAVLEIANGGLTVAEIASALMLRFPDEAVRDEVEAFVWELVDAQVLCCDGLVDITDENGLDRLLDHLPPDSDMHATVRVIASALNELDGEKSVTLPGAYASLTDSLAAMQIRSDRGLPTKVDLYASDEGEAKLSADIVAKIELVANELMSITRKRGKLADFVKTFSERYGDSEVPLPIVADQLEALGFSDRDASLPALSRMVRVEKKSAAQTVAPGIVEQVLALAVERMDETYVDITSLIDAAAVRSNSRADGATVVVWFSLWSEGGACGQPVLEIRSVGSQDPGRVMGRFAHGLPAVAAYLRESCRGPRSPVVEIVHQPEDRLGNISARPTLSDFEIRLRGGEPRSARRLALEDLAVSIVRERVVIRSKSLGKPIDLRMSNAHAYDRQGNLPIYRFLNHVSNQDHVADLFSLRKRIPKAQYTPGLKYHDVIVSKPTWLISADDISGLKKLPRALHRDALRTMRNARKMPDWVALVQGDNIIPYHLDNDWMVDDLLKYVFKSGEALLTEVFPQGLQPHLRSDAGPHFHELQLALRTRSPAMVESGIASAPHTSVVAPIWSRWAYFKLYVPPHLQNAVLGELKPPIDRLLDTSGIDGFFFVRYRDEGGAHLRLRFLASGGHALERTLPALRPAFDDLFDRGLVQKVSMDPYVREILRYGGDARCLACEAIFCEDSRLVLQALPAMDTGNVASWRDAAAAVDCMLLSFGMRTVEQRLFFARRAAADLAAEMKFASEERKRIGTIYSASKPLPLAQNHAPERADIPTADIFAAGIPGIERIWAGVISAPDPIADERLYAIQWSLIHMRLNRILNQDHRLQEAVIWELLKRSYASFVSRNERLVED